MRNNLVFSLFLSKLENLSNKSKIELLNKFTLNTLLSTDTNFIIKNLNTIKRKRQEELYRYFEAVKRKLLNSRDTLELELSEYNKEKIQLVDIFSENYPKILMKLSDPPILLFVKGKTFVSDKSVAIIGTRNATQKGIELAFELSKFLARRKWLIVSGLAKGIDTASHEGAIEAKGKTVAILGTPVSKISPKSNIELSKKIIENGAIVSEFEKNTPIRRSHFARRNRIIVALTQAVIIIETKERGGTINAIRYANNLRVPIFIPNIKQWEMQLNKQDETKNGNNTDEIVRGLLSIKHRKYFYYKRLQEIIVPIEEFDIEDFNYILGRLENICQSKN